MLVAKFGQPAFARQCCDNTRNGFAAALIAVKALLEPHGVPIDLEHGWETGQPFCERRQNPANPLTLDQQRTQRRKIGRTEQADAVDQAHAISPAETLRSY